jgi:hypothetical protein
MLDFDAVKVLLSRKLSHRSQPLVYECKQICNNLLWDEVDVKVMWIPSHVVLVSNECCCFHGSVGSRKLQTLVDLLILCSRGFLFDIGLRVKWRTGNFFPLH